MGRAAGLALLPLALTLTLTLTLTACGSSGPSSTSASASPLASSQSSQSSAGAYIGCLLQHNGGGPGSAQQACASLRPADLGAVLRAFENCLKKHGVTMPSLPAQGIRAALVRFVGELDTGSAAQRSALRSCAPSGISG
jgi:predicted small lipoprotein YifL